MRKNIVIISLFLAFSLILSACGQAAATPDLAGTVAAQVDAQVSTKVAAALAAIQAQQQAQATNTPLLPTVGSLPTVAAVNLPTVSMPGVATAIPCLATPLNMGENLPDGYSLYINTPFTKRWTLANEGSCIWNENYKIKFVSGDQMGGPSFKLFGTRVPPYQTITLELPLTTSGSVGTSTGYWGLYDDKDVYFGRVWVTINRVTVAPTTTAFSVTSAPTTVDNAGPVTCTPGTPHTFVFSASVTTDRAGTVTYHWIRDDNPNAASGTLTYSSAGTQTVSYSWTQSGPGVSSWMQLYIDSPNHQAFNQVAVTCS